MKAILWISTVMTVVFTNSCTNTNFDKEADGISVTEVPAKTELLSAEKNPPKSSKPLKSITELPIERVFELQQSGAILLIDTRSPIFYSLGHIGGAHSLPLKSFEKSFKESQSTIDSAVADGKKLVIYCQSEKCSDSYIMGKALQEIGYQVSVFKGGWELWKMSGL